MVLLLFKNNRDSIDFIQLEYNNFKIKLSTIGNKESFKK